MENVKITPQKIRKIPPPTYEKKFVSVSTTHDPYIDWLRDSDMNINSSKIFKMHPLKLNIHSPPPPKVATAEITLASPTYILNLQLFFLNKNNKKTPDEL